MRITAYGKCSGAGRNDDIQIKTSDGSRANIFNGKESAIGYSRKKGIDIRFFSCLPYPFGVILKYVLRPILMMCCGKSILNGVNSGGQSPLWMRGSDHDLTAAGCLTTPFAGLETYGVKMPSTVLMGNGGSDSAGLPGTGTADSFRAFWCDEKH